MMEPHAQARLFDLPTTEQVAATLTQTKGLPLPPALGAEIMKSPQMGLSRRVTFTGSGTLEAFGWDRGTLTYRRSWSPPSSTCQPTSAWWTPRPRCNHFASGCKQVPSRLARP